MAWASSLRYVTNLAITVAEDNDRVRVVGVVRFSLERESVAFNEAFAGFTTLGGTHGAAHREIGLVYHPCTRLGSLTDGRASVRVAIDVWRRVSRSARRRSLAGLLSFERGGDADVLWEHSLDCEGEPIELVLRDLAVR